jgi:2-oxoisovalerate dehydrogenase E1 component alpha subunit
MLRQLRIASVLRTRPVSYLLHGKVKAISHI